MAKKSWLARDAKREKLASKFAEKRKALKEAKDWEALQKLPRDASPTRVRTLCELTGRSRGVYRKFKLSRIKLRELALQGKIPGMRKASW